MNPDLIVIQILFLIHFGRILQNHATEGKILVTQVIWNCSSIKQMEAFKTSKQRLSSLQVHEHQAKDSIVHWNNTNKNLLQYNKARTPLPDLNSSSYAFLDNKKDTGKTNNSNIL